MFYVCYYLFLYEVPKIAKRCAKVFYETDLSTKLQSKFKDMTHWGGKENRRGRIKSLPSSNHIRAQRYNLNT